jgi:cysteine desulfurase
MFANNEIGTIQPIQELARIIKEKGSGALLHTDASQAPLFCKLDVDELGVDLVSLDGQKIYGPKGVGALYKREGVTLQPRMYGGAQEHGLRPGTENVPGIVGLAKAYALAEARRDGDVQNIRTLRNEFLMKLQELVPGLVVNGSLEKRLPNNLNVSVPKMESEFLVLALDAAGIAASARSACIAGGEGSPVVAALGGSRIPSAVRFSLGRDTTREELMYTAKVFAEKVSRL